MTSYVMVVSDADPKIVRDVVALDIGSTKDWLNKLTLTEAEEVEKIATSHPTHALTDTTIRKYAAQSSEMVQMKAFNTNY